MKWGCSDDCQHRKLSSLGDSLDKHYFWRDRRKWSWMASVLRFASHRATDDAYGGSA